MSINKKHPPVKLTVGSQYICMNTMDEDNQWTESFAEDVTELPTVINVEVTDNSDAYDTYASGAIYDSDTPVTSQEISEENVAFPAVLLAQLRGEEVDGGVVLGGGYGVRPFFAYGHVILNKDESKEFRWYPKCKLTENNDRSETSEESHKDQNGTITIKAYGFDNAGHTNVKALIDSETLKNVTAEKFFATPLLTTAAVKELNTEEP